QLEEIPLLINGVYTLPLGRFKPYVGVGVGAVASIFDGSNIPLSYFPGPDHSYSDMDVAFAYQAEVGRIYSLCKHVEVGVGYECVGTTDHHWHDNSVTLETDGNMTHVVSASLTWKF